MAKAVLAAYARGDEDEAMEPLALLGADGLPTGRILPGEPVIFYDIRGEREIELTQSFTDPAFSHFVTSGGTSEFVTMIQYDPSLDVRVAFPPEEHLAQTLSATVSQAGLRQLKVAESEKAVHLSYFFNGKSQEAEPGEERIT
ncbi:MAG TPA: phosphoglycerate mutase (2,3-diphosphoglycerate-independent), partial [bacterium]|nr:phosphoglycerate mutase (2,3-diphosphoglycerate-independent) [bacterium]